MDLRFFVDVIFLPVLYTQTRLIDSTISTMQDKTDSAWLLLQEAL